MGGVIVDEIERFLWGELIVTGLTVNQAPVIPPTGKSGFEGDGFVFFLCFQDVLGNSLIVS